MFADLIGELKHTERGSPAQRKQARSENSAAPEGSVFVGGRIMSGDDEGEVVMLGLVAARRPDSI